ncbi:MAG: hypothetical protein AAF399_02150, partial [Bacteroidota bacterium]
VVGRGYSAFMREAASAVTIDLTGPINQGDTDLNVLVNMDNNQHAPNENLRIGNMISGIKSILAILTSPIN